MLPLAMMYEQQRSKYEKQCTQLRRATGASAVILIFEREDGTDFSVQAVGDLIADLPERLEDLVARLRATRRRGLDS
ncbi:MAG: hypothetical protein ACREYF_22105 [Gammaproteobacteria bacterium]